MEITVGRSIRYEQDVQEFVIRESSAVDYSSAVVLLRNLGERRDTTSLEREAIAIAIRVLRHSLETKKI